MSKLIKSVIGCGLLLAGLAGPAPAATPTSWTEAGGGPFNQHASNSSASATKLTYTNLPQLKVRWFFPTKGPVSMTPTVEAGGVYVMASDGTLSKLNPDTGAPLWQTYVPGLLPSKPATISSQTSPAIGSDRVVVGMAGYVVAVNKTTGKLIWATQVETHPLVLIHQSPMIVGNQVFTGTMSIEESWVSSHAGYVPNFRGSAVALNLTTGALEWKKYMSPAGYTGADIWGSSAAADPAKNVIYFNTGNNFTVPSLVGACVRAAGTNTTAQRACLDPTDYVDSFVALNMTTGAVVWTRATIGADAWLPLASCNDAANTTCPTTSQNTKSFFYDADFAQGSSLFQLTNFTGVPDDRGGTSNGMVLGAGQKSGVYWALNPVNGGLFWQTRTVQRCCSIQWGSAVDQVNGMIYVPTNDESTSIGNDLVGRVGGAPVKNWVGGAWTGLNARTGAIVFQVPAPGQALDNPKLGGNTPGSISVTNDIVFAGTTSGQMVAFSPSGTIHWQYNANVVLISSPAIYNDRLYWGAGNYKPAISGTQKNGLYCFSVN